MSIEEFFIATPNDVFLNRLRKMFSHAWSCERMNSQVRSIGYEVVKGRDPEKVKILMEFQKELFRAIPICSVIQGYTFQYGDINRVLTTHDLKGLENIVFWYFDPQNEVIIKCLSDQLFSITIIDPDNHIAPYHKWSEILEEK